MPEILNQARSRATNLLSGFTTGQKTITAIAVFALIVGAVMFSSWASKPSYGALFTNLSPTDAAAVTQKLTSDKVSYRLTDSGTTVQVPLNQVYSERIKLAAAGLPADGQTGYSLLDKQGITTSEFTQQVDYQRALQGELAKTISAIDGVTAASVHLVVPQQDVFATGSQQASASVLVQMTPGQSLSPTQVQAVVHLVASSVPNLDPTNVTVTDSHGNVLAAPGTDGEQIAAGDTRQQQTQAFQNALAKSIQDMLTQVIGPNHAVVRVTADLNYDQRAVTSQTYPNSHPVPQNQSNNTETYSGNGTVPAGVVSTSPTTLVTGTGTNSTYSHTQTGTNYAVDQVTQQVVQAPGAVNRLSVAVAVDSNTRGLNTQTVQNLVAAAAGIVPSRGDTITVASVPFDTSLAAQTQKDLKAAASAKAHQKLMSEVKTGVILLVLLAVVLAVLRSARRAPQRLPIAISPDMTLEPGGAFELGAGDADLEEELHQLEEAEHADELRAVEAVPALAMHAHQLDGAHPEAIAGLLRDWMTERRG